MPSLDNTRHLTFVFNVTNLPDEYRIGELERGYKVIEVACWLGWNNVLTYVYTGDFPFVFADTTKLKYLNHVHWMQLQMIQHLPATAIYDYLEDL